MTSLTVIVALIVATYLAPPVILAMCGFRWLVLAYFVILEVGGIGVVLWSNKLLLSAQTF